MVSSTSLYPDDTARWLAVKKRDKNAASAFFYGVITTSIVCRPGCSSRTPLRDNTVFFSSYAEAREQGYRPCKRCRPDRAQPDSETMDLIIEACRTIEQADVPPGLNTLAEKAGLSPSYFQRIFKKIVGVSPKQYSVSHQLRRFQDNIRTQATVTDAIYQSGFSSSSRAYEKTRDLGTTPKEIKHGGASLTITYGIDTCILGWLLVGATNRGICSVEFADKKTALVARLKEQFPAATLIKGDTQFLSVVKDVISAIELPHNLVSLPLDIQGTVFQQKVWQQLQEIRPGETRSYSDIARLLGNPKAARAVARACAANKLAVLIPCHRVVAKDGAIGGYLWGSERKKQLLEGESKRGKPT